MLAGMSASRLILAVALGGALVQAACGSSGDRHGTYASASEASPTSDGDIRSSIPDGADLTEPIRWRVRVRGVSTSDVTAVWFLIDGELADVDRHEP